MSPLLALGEDISDPGYTAVGTIAFMHKQEGVPSSGIRSVQYPALNNENDHPFGTYHGAQVWDSSVVSTIENKAAALNWGS
jgi:hypothetical protein